MNKTIIVYGSTTGNTESLAQTILLILANHDIDITLKNVVDTHPDELDHYDFFLLGCSTWKNGSMQEHFGEFYKKLMFKNFKNRHFALFGTGRSEYDHFCTALDIIRQCLIERGASELIESLKIDGEAAAQTHKIRQWVQSLADVCVALHT